MERVITIHSRLSIAKYNLVLFVCCILSVSCQNQFVLHSDEAKQIPLTKGITDDLSEQYLNDPITFLADTSFTSWAHIKGLANRIKACETPDSILSVMTTEALLKSILNYPLNYSILCYDNPLSGVETISKKSSLHQVFASRPDAGTWLVLYFLNSKIDKNKRSDVRNEDYANLPIEDRLFLDYYLCSDDIAHVLTENNRDSLRSDIQNQIIQRMNDEDLCCPLLMNPLFQIEEISFDNHDSNTMDSNLRDPGITTIYTTFRQSLRGEVYEEMPQYLISWYNSTIPLQHPDASFLGSATNEYNCHSYAWHNQSTNNTVWLLSVNPSTSTFQLDKYWTNDLFVETSSSTGAIKAYYDATDPENDHSAIILPSGRFQSKWGAGPLMEHDWDDVPHEYLDSLVSLRFFCYRDTPLMNVYTFYGDTAVLPNTSHLYYVSPFEGVVNSWSAEYLSNNSNPYVLTWVNSSAGGTYSLTCLEEGAYKLYVDGYYQGHHVSWGEKLVVCVGTRNRYLCESLSDPENE